MASLVNVMTSPKQNTFVQDKSVGSHGRLPEAQGNSRLGPDLNRTNFGCHFIFHQ